MPRDAETCGPVVRDADRHVFVAVQHPGEEGTFAAPHSYFPDYVQAGAAGYVQAGGVTPAGAARAPRPAIVQVLPAVHAGR